MTVHARHRRNSWEHYLAIHAKKIADYSPHFIVSDELVPQVTHTAVIWRGALYGVDGLEINVVKVQDLSVRSDGRLAVQTQFYQYHILQRLQQGERNLFRYDNTHPYPDHPDAHHRHEYDDSGASHCQHLSERGWEAGDWPNLGQVIDEVYERRGGASTP